MAHLPIERTDVYRKFVDVADEVYALVQEWRDLPRLTMGTQLIRSIDSVGANLVEGDGRYSPADSIHFFVVARASAREAAYWIRRAQKRNVLDEVRASRLLDALDHGSRSLNNLISYRRNAKANFTREERADYGPTEPERLSPSRDSLRVSEDLFPPEDQAPKTQHLSRAASRHTPTQTSVTDDLP